MTSDDPNSVKTPSWITFLAPLALAIFGLAICGTAWTGISQLNAATTAVTSDSGDTSLSQYPIMKPVWDYYAPDGGSINIARVASNVQSTFLISGAIGFLLFGIGVLMLIQNPKPNSSEHH